MSDAAITIIVSGLVQVALQIVVFATLWIKLKYGAQQAEDAKTAAVKVEHKIDDATKKIDNNTAIAKGGAAASVVSAKVAAQTKASTDSMVQELKTKMNGGVDSAIEAAIKPIREALQDHILQYELDMRGIRDMLADLQKRLK